MELISYILNMFKDKEIYKSLFKSKKVEIALEPKEIPLQCGHFYSKGWRCQMEKEGNYPEWLGKGPQWCCWQVIPEEFRNVDPLQVMLETIPRNR